MSQIWTAFGQFLQHLRSDEFGGQFQVAQVALELVGDEVLDEKVRAVDEESGYFRAERDEAPEAGVARYQLPLFAHQGVGAELTVGQVGKYLQQDLSRVKRAKSFHSDISIEQYC